MGLDSARLEDSRRTGQDGGTRDDSAPADNSVGAASRRSPLDLGARSYATKPTAADGGTEEEPTAASLTSMLNEQQTRDQRMRETAEQFTGMSMEGGRQYNEETSEATEQRTAEQRTEEEGTEKDTDEDEELRQAQLLASSQMLLSTEIKRAKAQAEEQQKKAFLLEQEEKQKQLKMIWDVMKGSEGITSLSLVTLIVLIITLNVQLVNLIFNYPKIPKPTIADICITVCLDCSLCISILPMLLSATLIVVTVAIAAMTVFSSLMGAINSITSLFK